jgi:hypothetical protein
MMTRLATVLFALAVWAAPASAADKGGVFLDPKEAGPDYLVQGEYAGTAGGALLGAQVVALGDGQFDVYFLAGGLPGAGWDTKGRVKASGKTEGEKTVVDGGGWSGAIAGGTLSGKSADGAAVALKKVERKSATLGEKPPAGAVVLFDGTSADAWQNGRLVEDSLLNCGVTTKKTFGDMKLHLEFRLCFKPKGRGQDRSNSGCYLAGRHEVQVLDSFGLTGEHNECGGIYSVEKPTVNMCLPPLVWQTYDIEYRLAKGAQPARMTVWLNGVKVHENTELKKNTTAAPNNTPPDQPGPIHLQDHGNPVVYRNVWLMEMK